MFEKWEIHPDITPPGYPLQGVYPPKQHQEICARIRTDYERQREEQRRQEPRRKIERLKAWIEFLLHCQQTPGPERYRLLRDGKCVYLMWSPKYQAYRIGHTKRPWSRTGEHRRNLDPKIEQRVAYFTLISRRMLERFLHRHFKHHRTHEDVSKELFDLPQTEAEDLFKSAAETIERHLLSIELLRLNARRSELEKECREAE